jgi:hypothetical protein
LTQEEEEGWVCFKAAHRPNSYSWCVFSPLASDTQQALSLKQHRSSPSLLDSLDILFCWVKSSQQTSCSKQERCCFPLFFFI